MEKKDGENQDQIKLEEEMSAEELAEQTAAEEFVLAFKDEDYDDPAKVEQLKESQKMLATTIAQKRHYRDKYKDATKEKPPVVPPVVPPKKEGETQETIAEKEASNKRTSLLELRQEGFSKESAEEIYKAAQTSGMTVEAVLQSPIFKPFIEQLKTKEDVEGASFTPSKRGGMKGDDIDWSKATPAQVLAHRNKINAGGDQ